MAYKPPFGCHISRYQILGRLDPLGEDGRLLANLVTDVYFDNGTYASMAHIQD